MARKRGTFIEAFGKRTQGGKAPTAVRNVIARGKEEGASPFPKLRVPKPSPAKAAPRAPRAETTAATVTLRRDWLIGGGIGLAALLLLVFGVGYRLGGRTTEPERADLAGEELAAFGGGRTALDLGDGPRREDAADAGPTAPSSQPKRFWSARIVTYRTRTEAERTVAQLVEQGHRAFPVPVRNNMWAVCVGEFEQQDDPRLALLIETFRAQPAYSTTMPISLERD